MWVSRRTVREGYEGLTPNRGTGSIGGRDERAGLERGPGGEWDAETLRLSCLLETDQEGTSSRMATATGRLGSAWPWPRPVSRPSSATTLPRARSGTRW